MSITQLQPRPQPNAQTALVAKNLTALLDDNRWSGRKAAARLHMTQGYISRRTSGQTELSIADITMFSDLLGMTPAELTERLLLPHLDSDQEPIGFQHRLTNLDEYRNNRAPTPRNTTHNRHPHKAG